MIQADIIVNGITMQFVYDKRSSYVQISQEKALEMLRAGTIKKDDFEGNADELIGDGFIADKATFNIKTVRLGNATIDNVVATVNYRLTKPFLLTNDILNRFGKFTVDDEAGMIIFE